MTATRSVVPGLFALASAAVLAAGAAGTSGTGLAASPADAAAVAAAPGQTDPTEAYRLVETWDSRRPNSGVPDFQRPAGLDVASDGTIYVADSRARKVYHLDNRGRELHNWTPGSSVVTPVDVAVTNDRVYVVGGPNDDGEIRDRAGNPIGTFEVDRPSGVAVGPDGRVYVSRSANINGRTVAAIDVRDADGNALETWSGEPLIRIRNPFGLDVGADGSVYLAAEGSIYIFRDGAVVSLLRVRSDIEGADLTDVSVDGDRVYATLTDIVAGWQGGNRMTPPDIQLDGAQALAIGPGGGLVISAYSTNGLAGLHYMADRTNLTSALAFWGRAEDALGDLVGPSRIDVAGSGSVFFADQLTRVQEWQADGEPVAQWTGHLATDVAGGGARACTTDGEEVSCLGANGAVAWSARPPSAGWLAALDGNSNSLYAVDLAQQVVWVIDRVGAFADSQPLDPSVSFAPISDIAVDTDALFLADRSDNTVSHRSLDGQMLGTWPVPRGPVRISAAEGSVFVLTLDGYVWKHGRDGALQTVFRPPEEASDIAAGPQGRLYVTSEDGNHIYVYGPDAAGTPPPLPPPAPADTCEVNVDKTAVPDVVIQGDPVTVRLDVSGACPFGESDLDIMLVMDRSGSMVEPRMTAAKSAAVAFLAELNPNRTKVGVVGFSTDAGVVQPLTGDIKSVVTAVAGLSIGGQTFFQEALDLTTQELTGAGSRPTAGHIAVMMTDGQPTDRVRGQQAADRLKAAGVTLYVVGLGDDLDHDLMREMASTPDLYFPAPSASELAAIYTAIARRIGATKLLQTATVTDELPSDMVLVQGSVVPPAAQTGRTLTWQLSDVPNAGTRLSYQVRPSVTGRRPTNVSAALDYVDTLDTAGRAVFPVPEVEVLPRQNWPVYLPTVANAECTPQRADVALVLDASSSMLEPGSSGGLKIDEALQAARAFLDGMSLPEDQAAIVVFDSEARVVQGLTGSRGVLEFALAGISVTGTGTRIDKGIDAGLQAVLGAGHRSASKPVMVVMTDGKPSGGSEGTTVGAAGLAQDLGITVYSIGLGTDPDPLLLEIIAGDPARYYFAPDTAALERIYATIAGEALCQ